VTYDVIVEPAALADIARAYRWLAARNTAAAERWLEGLTAVRDSLSQFPARHRAVAGATGRQGVRRLIYGRGRSKYHVFYVIQGTTVRILRLRHAARRPVSR
jgi:plasmid stabilization system protein ParE